MTRFITPLQLLDLQPQSTFRGENRAARGDFQRNRSLAGQCETEIPQQIGQSDAGLHHTEAHSDANAGSFTERQETIRIPLGHFFRCKAIRVVLFWIGVVFCVVVEGVHRHDQSGSLLKDNVAVGEFVVLGNRSGQG